MLREFTEKDLLAPELERLEAQAAAARVGVGPAARGPVGYRISMLTAAMAERGYELGGVELKGRHYHELEQERHPERVTRGIRVLGAIVEPTLLYGTGRSALHFEHVSEEGPAVVHLED